MSMPRQSLVIALSVALNLFLAGWIVGDWTRTRTLPAPAPAAQPNQASGEPRGMVNRMVAALPADQREQVETRFAARRDEAQRIGRNIRALRQKLGESIGAETFDRTAVEATLAQLRQQNTAAATSFHTALLDSLAGLPPEARRAMVASMARGRDHRP
jgi:uncharacterized membrane protein